MEEIVERVIRLDTVDLLRLLKTKVKERKRFIRLNIVHLLRPCINVIVADYFLSLNECWLSTVFSTFLSSMGNLKL